MANLRVRDNFAGRIAAGNLGKNQSKLAKSIEKLASGYRITRSADDASGLAISEKMRALKTGLEQAQENSLDGLSLVETGEAALQEIHTVLNRIVELSTTSANGIYRDDLDREAMQQELDHYYEEVKRISGNANFNGIKLFQDKGLEFEEVFQGAVHTSGREVHTLDEVLANTKNGEVNIIYTEENGKVTTTQTPEGPATPQSNIVIDGKNLSDILKKEIIPNTVQNILKNYPAFSYLNGSSIGIGLEYFSQGASGGSTTLAYVKASSGSGGQLSGGTLVSRTDYMTYTLGVNTSVLAGVTDRDGLEELEATIAHEMIHAFMDEATTSGMFGKMEASTSDLTTSVDKFPDWFIEGMAQTASGPDNWLRHMGITDSSSEADIAAAIGREKLGSGSTASQYGTGYLACMYLGAAIAGGGTPSAVVDAKTVSEGLTALFNEVIGGTSLNGAIYALTNGKYTSYTNFETQFNSGPAEVASFVRNLLKATGNGRGGIISGDLKDTDLTPNTDLGDTVKLFQLDPTTNGVKNVYPDKYSVYSGGAASVNGTKPTDFTPALVTPPIECGDLIINGAKPSDISYDSQTGVLTVNAAGDIKISMKVEGQSSVLNKIRLEGSGKVTLNGVLLSDADALQINSSTEITYEGWNEFGGITLGNNVNTEFHGYGQLKALALTSDSTNTVRFDGGAVVVGSSGTGQIDAGNVIIDHASVAATIPATVRDSNGTELKSTDIPWPMLRELKDVASITFNGTESKMLIVSGKSGKLWLDPDLAKNVITVMDSAGTKKTLAAEYNNNKFDWLRSIKPFTVAGGQEGVDWEYADDETLVIKSNARLTISGGIGTDATGANFPGRIKIADGIGNAELVLDDVHCNVNSGSALELGKGNQVKLTLTDGKTSSFTSGLEHAGISIGAGTDLTIEGTDNSKLVAAGGTNGAGIGSSGNAKLKDPKSSVTINGGNIEALGGNHGAGIGAGDGSDFGDITINGGIINAKGGSGGAGVGGGNDAKVGNIAIKDAAVTASSTAHGAGIGGGWGQTATNGEILIESGIIRASSTEHGTGIGAGCQGTSGKITIKGGTIHTEGGADGAGIGASWNGECGDIEIIGGDIDASGGRNGSGIGAGSSNSDVKGSIVIDTTGTVTATGGVNGVGIGSGQGNSSCGDIEIRQGTVKAVGSTDSTGIGAGRDSTSGNVTIGDKADPDKKVNVDAFGGMTNNGGNILSYGDGGHTQPGNLTITGNNTTVRPGSVGEGLYSTSGAVDENGDKVYSYPVYLFKKDPPLSAGEGLDSKGLPLPDGVNKDTVKISAVSASGTKKEWEPGLIHEPDNNYAFLWLGGEDQKLTIDYQDTNGASKSITLDLKFHPDSGLFRIGTQPTPPPAQKPGYVTNPTPNPPNPPEPEEYAGGIVLHIGAGSKDTLGIPRYYLSADSLKMNEMDISTQEKARNTMDMVGDAIDRVSSIRASYGAYARRLEHNQQYLGNTIENTTAAESRIRDLDMANEYKDYICHSIKTQAAQSILAHSNQDASQVLQLLQ